MIGLFTRESTAGATDRGRRRPVSDRARPRDTSADDRRDAQPSRLRMRRASVDRSGHLRVVVDPNPASAVTIVVAIALLCLIGLVFVLSASMVTANHTRDTSWFYFYRQLFFLGLGAVAMYVTSRVDYHRWVNWGGVLFVAALSLLVVVLIPSPISHAVNGSRRWLGLGFVQGQPSEFAKLALILWLARLLERHREQMDQWRTTVVPALFGLGVMVALVIVEPDMGTTLLLALVCVIMLFVAGARLDAMALMSVPFLAVVAFYLSRGYHRARILAFLDPWQHAQTEGWQTLQSQVGLASGGWFGVGIGNSKAKWGFLPEAHTDFIFAIIGEELGLIGCLLVVGLFYVLLITGLKAAWRAPDVSGRLVGFGIATWIGFQALINIGVSVGVLPNKGITLPFVSYGGSSVVITMAAAGILCNVARRPTTASRRRRIRR